MNIIKLLNFPSTRQSTNYSCGASAVQSVLCYYGIHVREDILIDRLTVSPEHGVDPDIIAIALQEQWNLRTNVHYGMTIQDLKSYINKDIPIILSLQAWSDTSVTDYSDVYIDGHYVVAIGYSDTAIIFNDPSILDNYGYILNDDLLTRWHDTDIDENKFYRLGIAVLGTPSFDQTKILPIL